MSDPNVKTVNVQVEMGSTEHALLTGAKKTRRRRNATSTQPIPVGSSPSTTLPNDTNNVVKVAKVPEVVTAPVSLSPQAAPATLPPPQNQVNSAAPVLPPEPTSAPVVKIAPKMGQAPPTQFPRILPKKRIGTAPAAETLKQKPKFVVEASPQTSQKGGASESEQPTSGNNRSGVVRSRTRRTFKERRISLTVQPVKKSRKYRRTLRARVVEMPLQQVRRILLRKGILKQKKDSEKMPPDDMMRSMLVDYMMLHHAD